MPIAITIAADDEQQSGNGIEVAYASRVPIQQPIESSAT